jgi:hypothetical protein
MCLKFKIEEFFHNFPPSNLRTPIILVGTVFHITQFAYALLSLEHVEPLVSVVHLIQLVQNQFNLPSSRLIRCVNLHRTFYGFSRMASATLTLHVSTAWRYPNLTHLMHEPYQASLSTVFKSK